jgi:hypothetical protein
VQHCGPSCPVLTPRGRGWASASLSRRCRCRPACTAADFRPWLCSGYIAAAEQFPYRLWSSTAMTPPSDYSVNAGSPGPVIPNSYRSGTACSAAGVGIRGLVADGLAVRRMARRPGRPPAVRVRYVQPVHQSVQRGLVGHDPLTMVASDGRRPRRRPAPVVRVKHDRPGGWWTNPTGSAVFSSPGRALDNCPPRSRTRMKCRSAWLLVPLTPRNNRSSNSPGVVEAVLIKMSGCQRADFQQSMPVGVVPASRDTSKLNRARSRLRPCRPRRPGVENFTVNG